jgi:NAD(P)-dependent dehydrogenase (short-subunit alcohol dehydrogenase family)
MKLKGKVAVVVGGASGMGRSACEIMAAEGATVFVGDVNAEAGEAARAAAAAHGQPAHYVHTDVMDEASIATAFQQAFDLHGRVDVAVSSAGKLFKGVPDAWLRNIDMFLRGTYFVNKYAVEHMLKTGSGSIVNVSSVAGVTGSAGSTVEDSGYGVAKHGVIGLTRALALRYAKNNIRVNAVCPGFMKTELTRFQWGDPAYDDYIARQGVPMNRWGEPEEVGKVVSFLASDDSSFITGQPIIVDGGFMAR